ncbi:CoA ester lyase [Antrihabitans sp. YC2-6]|uniref:HpcH/HpaI aldolase/citrate lyase family protein n=1 Tax=Antrihabitans sp. YC2-6 TaxID=2799498 RepID=UPI0018F77728|nr:CoA ester lyase [Antrihabitans sp. YC2-6]MBJ8343278.1 CoA ester lyase [Antrihabitans sp. YC2-6]
MAGHRIPAELARSWLLVPATKPEAFAPVPEDGVDAVIIDIEDAVSPPQKAAARRSAVDWLNNVGNAWVRLNDATTSFWAEDLEALAACKGLAGVMLAKVESGYQIEATADRLPEGTRILALIESAMGLEAAPEIARASGTFRLAFGSGDFRRDTGMSDDPAAMAYPRARLVICSRAARLPGPIDGPTVNRNESILRRDSALAASMGMTGRLCMHPEQALAVNQGLSPSADDVVWARDVITELGENGEHVRDGSDKPRLAKAIKIRTLATAFGIG